MFGWTILLIWGVMKPIERADILIITVFPVVTILAVAAGLVVKSNQIPFDKILPMFILYVVVFLTFIPSYLWAKKQAYNKANQQTLTRC